MTSRERNALVVAYMPLALSEAGKLVRRFKFVDRDDARSEAMLGLVEAGRAFDATRGAFPSFARVWIMGRLMKLTRKNIADTNIDPLLENTVSTPDHSDEVIERVSQEILEKKLTVAQQRGINGLRKGISLSQTARDLGVNRSTIHRRVKQAREKMNGY